MNIKVIAPLRISLFGGGTDLPIYYEKHNGITVSMAVNLYQTLELSDELKPKKTVIPENGSLDFFAPFGFDGLSIMNRTDAPPQSGMGGSASLAVACGFTKHVLAGDIKIDRELVAEEAWTITNKELGFYSGKQDEYAAALGGFNKIEWRKPDILIHKLPEELGNFWQQNILLFFTGRIREDAKLQERFKDFTAEKIAALDQVKEIAYVAYEEGILRKDVEYVGTLMDDAWHAKKQSNRVSNERIDRVYDEALKAGALGGKLLGSGGGGHMIFIVKPEEQKTFIQNMKDLSLTHVPFEIEWKGARVV